MSWPHLPHSLPSFPDQDALSGFPVVPLSPQTPGLVLILPTLPTKHILGGGSGLGRLWDPSPGVRLSGGDTRLFQAWPLTSLKASSTGSAPGTTPSTAATWTGVTWRSSTPCGTSWARPQPWPSWVRLLVGAGTGAEQARLHWLGRWGGPGSRPGLPALPGALLGGPSPGTIPSCCPRGQAVVGRSGVGEDGHLQQGGRLGVRGSAEQHHPGDAHEGLR